MSGPRTEVLSTKTLQRQLPNLISVSYISAFDTKLDIGKRGWFAPIMLSEQLKNVQSSLTTVFGNGALTVKRISENARSWDYPPLMRGSNHFSVNMEQAERSLKDAPKEISTAAKNILAAVNTALIGRSSELAESGKNFTAKQAWALIDKTTTEELQILTDKWRENKKYVPRESAAEKRARAGREHTETLRQIHRIEVNVP